MEIAISVIVAILIIGLIVWYGLKKGNQDKNKIKGQEGEELVKEELGLPIPGHKYILNDYYTTLNNRSTQIDHILINSRGVFIIETKNYSGMLLGNEEQKDWTMVLAGGKTKHKVHNPIKQNKSHVYAIRKFIPKDIPVYPVVVLVQDNADKIDVENVVNLCDLKDYIHSKAKALESETITSIYEKLKAKNEKKNISEEEHIEGIHKMQEDINNNICPRCGGKLVKRTGKYGDFLGCENYPKCKFHKEL